MLHLYQGHKKWSGYSLLMNKGVGAVGRFAPPPQSTDAIYSAWLQCLANFASLFLAGIMS